MDTQKPIIEQDTNNDSDMNTISPAERAVLDDSIVNIESRDNQLLKIARLDNTDEDGELLNESTSADDYTGEDLDIPGAEEDDANEKIGEEDEENNSYSQADTE